MRGVGFVLAAGAVLLLAACGSSASTTAAGAPTSNSTSASTAPPTSGSPASVVMTASNASLGTLVVDTAGKTLYTLTNASGKAVPCTGQCLTFWPPLLLPAGMTSATGPTGVTGLGTVTTADGTQVTDNGLPLYTFSLDTAAGMTNGEGKVSFGGTWHVVKTSAAAAATTPPTSPPASAAPPAPTTTAGGYNY